VTLVGAANATLPHEEALDEVRGTAARAASLGVKTELLRVTTRHPVRALLQIVVERDAGLLVFGPDRSRVRGLRWRTAVRRVRRDAPCLVWVAPDG
jgi:nucleotide-binding universal stress UspA family protein